MIHVIEGDGKGKTTASIGLSVRAAGHGYRVLFIQFLKDDTSGEISVLRSIAEITVLHAPVNYGFTFQMTDEEKRETAEEYNRMLDFAIDSDTFLIVLDEITHVLNEDLVKREKIEKVLEKDCEIMLTGRNAPKWLVDRADYVSYVQKIKHPYDRGIEARVGIEF